MYHFDIDLSRGEERWVEEEALVASLVSKALSSETRSSKVQSGSGSAATPSTRCEEQRRFNLTAPLQSQLKLISQNHQMLRNY